MSSFKVLLCIVFGLLALSSSHVNANCNQCSRNSFAACINETAFHPCLNGMDPANQILSCSTNQICADQVGVCVDKSTGIMPACAIVNPECNKCSGLFACVSQTQFSYCDASGNLGVVGSCDPGQYCSITSLGPICAPTCVTAPTCSNTQVTTVSPITADWKATCIGTSSAGYYKNIRDSSCQTYVYCEMSANVMNAIFYTCTSGYFNQPTQRCVATKPTGCT